MYQGFPILGNAYCYNSEANHSSILMCTWAGTATPVPANTVNLPGREEYGTRVGPVPEDRLMVVLHTASKLAFWAERWICTTDLAGTDLRNPTAMAGVLPGVTISLYPEEVSSHLLSWTGCCAGHVVPLHQCSLGLGCQGEGAMRSEEMLPNFIII